MKEGIFAIIVLFAVIGSFYYLWVVKGEGDDD